MKTKPIGGAFIASQDDLTVIAATRGDALQALAVQVFARILDKRVHAKQVNEPEKETIKCTQ